MSVPARLFLPLLFAFVRGSAWAGDAGSAVEEYRLGCESGHAADCSFLGSAYASGSSELVEHDVAQAAEFFGKAALLDDKACDRGDASACLDAGVLYDHSFAALPQGSDPGKALAFYRKACALKSAKGCFAVGESYFVGWGKDEKTSKRAADKAEAYRKACELGHAPGCRRLAEMYGSGTGVAKDKAKAAGLRVKACVLDPDSSDCAKAAKP